jgi:transposase-like protein
MFKVCCMCKNELSVDQFSSNTRRKDGLQSQCKKCHAEYRKQHYLNNRRKYIDRSAEYRKRTRIAFFEWLKTKSCVDCSNSDFRVLEFDHRQDKKFNISDKVGALTMDALMEEINKCDIVCANCHRIRTANQFDYYAYMN